MQSCSAALDIPLLLLPVLLLDLMASPRLRQVGTCGLFRYKECYKGLSRAAAAVLWVPLLILDSKNAILLLIEKTLAPLTSY